MVFEGINYEAIMNVLTKEQIGWSAKTRICNIQHVVIPDCLNGLPVLELGPYLFSKDNLETVQIPSTVEIIGFRAFIECPNLHTVTIYQSDKGKETSLRLYGDVFKHCINLKKINGKKSLKFLGTGVFSNCKKLNLSLDTPIYGDIPTAAFFKCEALKNVQIVGQNVHISPTAFRGCNELKRIILDCDSVDFGDKCFNVIKDKQFLCVNECNAVDLAYLGLNVIVMEDS